MILNFFCTATLFCLNDLSKYYLWRYNKICGCYVFQKIVKLSVPNDIKIKTIKICLWRSLVFADRNFLRRGGVNFSGRNVRGMFEGIFWDEIFGLFGAGKFFWRRNFSRKSSGKYPREVFGMVIRTHVHDYKSLRVRLWFRPLVNTHTHTRRYTDGFRLAMYCQLGQLS